MHIQQMQHLDLNFATACTAAEGWISETRSVFEAFLAHDAAGCFVATVDGRRVGICVATAYRQAGFIGELIVIPGMRGQGIGRHLLEHAVHYLQRRGISNVLLDGVPAAVSLYERAGFRKICRSLRFTGTLEDSPAPSRSVGPVRQMRSDDLPAVQRLDRQAFGEERSFFLAHHFSSHPALCHVWEAQGKVLGYVMARPAQTGFWVGPWVAREDLDDPGPLLKGLAAVCGYPSLSLGILETNRRAVTLARTLGLAARPDPPWRMVLGPSSRLGLDPRALAIGAPARG